MRLKYIVKPGYYNNLQGGPLTYMTASELMAAYRVSPHECIESIYLHDAIDTSTLHILTVDQTGQYLLPGETKQCERIVIYHRKQLTTCYDGFGAALAAKLHSNWQHAEYIAMCYGETPPDVAGKDVLILDFSFPREILKQMHFLANTLLVIDHHKTAKDDLVGLPYCIFNMSKSGAVLTWEYLHGNVPELIKRIGDRDLWKFEYPDTDAVTSALGMYPVDFATWGELCTVKAFKRLASRGEVLVRYRDNIVNTAIDAWLCNPTYIDIQGHIVPLINCSILVSEICGKLAEHGLFAVAYNDSGNTRSFSLRSRVSGYKTDQFDVSVLAVSLGGGGHAGAAGFTMSVSNSLLIQLTAATEPVTFKLNI